MVAAGTWLISTGVLLPFWMWLNYTALEISYEFPIWSVYVSLFGFFLLALGYLTIRGKEHSASLVSNIAKGIGVTWLLYAGFGFLVFSGPHCPSGDPVSCARDAEAGNRIVYVLGVGIAMVALGLLLGRNSRSAASRRNKTDRASTEIERSSNALSPPK